MTTTNRGTRSARLIRAAALGPPPRHHQHTIGGWVGLGTAWDVIATAIYDRRLDLAGWLDLTNHERRMFMLFVAEALEGTK